MFFFSNIICLASCLWQAKAGSYGSFMAARVLDGIGAAANETLGPLLIADIFFLHERGLWNGLYFLSLFCSCAMGPIIGGYVASSHLGWRVSPPERYEMVQSDPNIVTSGSSGFVPSFMASSLLQSSSGFRKASFSERAKRHSQSQQLSSSALKKNSQIRTGTQKRELKMLKPRPTSSTKVPLRASRSLGSSQARTL